jgi:hypothetical protein
MLLAELTPKWSHARGGRHPSRYIDWRPYSAESKPLRIGILVAIGRSKAPSPHAASNIVGLSRLRAGISFWSTPTMWRCASPVTVGGVATMSKTARGPEWPPEVVVRMPRCPYARP